MLGTSAFSVRTEFSVGTAQFILLFRRNTDQECGSHQVGGKCSTRQSIVLFVDHNQTDRDVKDDPDCCVTRSFACEPQYPVAQNGSHP
jgi:hypothetical protein